MTWGIIIIDVVLIGTMITSTIGFIWKDQSVEDVNREKIEFDIGRTNENPRFRLEKNLILSATIISILSSG